MRWKEKRTCIDNTRTDMKKFVSPLPGLRILLTVLLVLLACQPGRANEGYWVLDKASPTGGGGSKAFQFKVTKTSATVVSTGSADGTTFIWPELPDKIKFGDEAKLEFPVQINCPDPATAKLIRNAKMMSLTVSVSMWDPYECRDYTTLNNPFQWRTEVTGSGTVSRRPDVDIHEDIFTPTSESTLTISIVASLNTPITVDGKAVSGLTGGRTYVYKYVGDKPIYGIKTGGKKNPGEFGKIDIPDVLFWVGGAVVGVIGVNQIRKNRKKKKKGGKDPEPEEEKPKKNPSTFRMILYKEFGDTLYAGGDPKVVGARIEEQTPEGQRIDRTDLTRMIRLVEGENIQLLSTGFDGKYMCGSIQVPEPKQTAIPPKGSVIFHFETPTGILRNEVEFFIEDNKKILFTQENITFVAGHNNTETVYFYLIKLLRVQNYCKLCESPNFASVFLLFLRHKQLITTLFDMLLSIRLRESGTNHAGTMSILGTFEGTILVSGLLNHIIVFHYQEESELLPTANHLVTLLTTIVRQQFDTFFCSG